MNAAHAVAFVVGLFVGGLLNLVIVRLPRERGMAGWPRCTRCGRRLAWWQALPLIGWLAQGGRARCCGRRLSLIYPLVELTSGVTLALLYAQHGLSASLVYLFGVAAVLIIIGAIDWQTRLIYTLPVIGATVAAMAGSFVIPRHSPLNALLGVIAAGFVFLIFFVLARALFPGKWAPFGLGDVYLGIFIGAAVGLTNLAPALLYGMLLAGLFSAVVVALRRSGRRDLPEYIAYGAFLCVGALLYILLWGLAGPGSA